jgi:glucose dehydrogenase
MAGRRVGGFSGANVWGFMTVDVQNGLVFLPIGTPTPDFCGGGRKGSNLYRSSVVALAAATGKMKWFFQNHSSRQLGLRRRYYCAGDD